MTMLRVRIRRPFVFALGVLLLYAGAASAQKVPTPEEVLGFKVGADYKLATYTQAYSYFKALEQASPMIKVYEMGKTPMGHPFIYAVITAKENMAKLDRYRDIAKRLSLVKGVSEEEAAQLAAEGKAVIYIDGGLHASECAPAQQNIQLAYDLLSRNDPKTTMIRQNVILVLVFANPDGMESLADWYSKNVGTPFEVSGMPWVYNKYSGHDNNRDSYMANLVETQYLTKIVNQEWFPQVLYNQHQTAPFPARIWVHPASEPTNPNVHPLLIRWQNLLGSAMGSAFDRENKPGAISRITFDTWYPGYVTQVVDSHNIASLLTETALYRYATPKFYTLEDFPDQYKDFIVGTFYPSPWKGGWWRLRDAVDYCETASMAVLETAALYRQELLLDKYHMGKDVIAKFTKEPPYAWVLPQDQWDPPTAALLLSKMQLLGIEVYAAEKPFTADGVAYGAGTWVIPMQQPFAYFVKNVFEEQSYPDLTKYPDLWEGLVSPTAFKDAYLPPYDIGGWTLPYQMGVKSLPVNSPLNASLTLLEKVELPPVKADRAVAGTLLISPKMNNSFTAVNRILKAGGDVARAREAFTAGGEAYPAGTFIVTPRNAPAATFESIAKDLSVPVRAGASTVKSWRMKAPRLGLYQSWTGSMDEGWTRWLLDQFEFSFTNVHDAEMRAGSLGKTFDVIVIPSMSTSAIVEGNKLGTMPPQYVGGIGDVGVQNLREFVRQGGTLVLLNNASLFAIDKFGLPISDALKDLRAPSRREAGASPRPVEFACPGSVLRMKFDVTHPVGYGMPEEAPGMFIQSPAFTLNPSFGSDSKSATAIATYPGSEILMSGYLKGEKFLTNKVAAAEATLGKGRVILLGFGVQQRGQPYGTFKVLFNSIYYGAMQAENEPARGAAR